MKKGVDNVSENNDKCNNHNHYNQSFNNKMYNCRELRVINPTFQHRYLEHGISEP